MRQEKKIISDDSLFQSCFDRHLLQLRNVLRKTHKHLPLHHHPPIQACDPVHAGLHHLHLPPHIPGSSLLHQPLHWGLHHGILPLLAVCLCLLMDFSSHEYHRQTLLNILHR